MKEHRSLIEKRSSNWKYLSRGNVGIALDISDRRLSIVPIGCYDVGKVLGLSQVPLGGVFDTDNLAKPGHPVVEIVFFVSDECSVMAAYSVIRIASDEAGSFDLFRANVREALEVTYFGPEAYLRV